MIHRFVKLKFARRDIPEIKPLFESIAPKVRGFEGCKYLEILYDVRDSGKVVTYSHWESEAHLETYRNSEVFQSFWSLVKPRFIKPAEAWSMSREIQLD
ncbi:MAG: putative quinol monooxygenase [Cryomorphaceae bacterium]